MSVAQKPPNPWGFLTAAWMHWDGNAKMYPWGPCSLRFVRDGDAQEDDRTYCCNGATKPEVEDLTQSDLPGRLGLRLCFPLWSGLGASGKPEGGPGTPEAEKELIECWRIKPWGLKAGVIRGVDRPDSVQGEAELGTDWTHLLNFYAFPAKTSLMFKMKRILEHKGIMRFLLSQLRVMTLFLMLLHFTYFYLNSLKTGTPCGILLIGFHVITTSQTQGHGHIGKQGFLVKHASTITKLVALKPNGS